MNHQAIEHCGQLLWLLPDKSIYWPAQRALLVADVHIGKAASYRALHQPVPRGTTEANFARLDALLEAYDCESLIVLGDFLHARTARAPATLARLHAWRERHQDLKIVLIRGNHDRNAGDPPASLNIEVQDEPWILGPFALQHEPKAHPTHPVLAGHVHPVFVLRGKARQRLRLPCFLIDAQVSLLPAFGEFTGGWEVTPAGTSQVYLAGAGRVWPL
ncbi:ligase-associated DNA damage response endonuclease PdeM [Pseudomonas sp. LB-090624]|uniref:ligase-associated DNA damage response endonuclease PdeM n=1 Tax=Pseudomonas sp. LB-090624 TaxID=2213079 RepID=UPI000D9D1DA7|nr:ligase-associated DNA damage response endonuclease PdeM [Pseudomonas sp. LB-090624]PYB82137.1 ligase-associated DNA damage response endonuclease PdeM [Pseudomonas sp. LB-090624]